MGRYVVAVAATAVMVFIRWLLDPWMGDTYAFVTIFGAVAAAVWYGGYRPALLAVGLGLAACEFLFVVPRGSIAILHTRDAIGLILYLFTNGLIVGIGEAMRLAQRREKDGHELFQVTVASIGDAVIATDVEGRITYLNPVAESLTGWTQKDATGQPLETVFRIVNELTRKAVESPVIKALQHGRAIGLANHTILIAKDGTELPIDDSAAPIRDRNGKVVGCVLVFRDITERHQQEARLREQDRQFRTLADSIPMLCWMAEPDGQIFWYNRRWYEYTATTLEEMQGWGWEKVHDPTELPKMLPRWKSALAAGEPWEDTFPLRRHDGEFRPHLSRAFPLKDDAGRVVRWFGTNTDISEIKQSEAALRSIQFRLQTFIDHVPVAIAMFDRDMRYLAVSRRWLTEFGLQDDPTGQCHYEVFPHPLPERWKEAHRRGLAGEVVRADEDLYQPDDRVEQWLRWEVRPWYTSTREVGGILIYSEDITQRKRAEEQLRESEAFTNHVSDIAPSVLYVYDLDEKRNLWGNRATYDGLGYNREELDALSGNLLATLMHPDDFARYPHHAARMASLENGQIAEFEYRMRAADGSWRWLISRDMVFRRADQGRVTQIIGAALDITDRKRAEERLREQEERLRLAVEATGVGIFDFDPISGRQVFSEQAMKIWGFAPGTVPTPELVLNTVHPDDRDWVRAAAQASLDVAGNGHFRVKYRIVRTNGEIRWVAMSGQTTFCGRGTEAVRSVGTMLDITETEQALREVRESQRREEERAAVLETVLRATPTAIWITHDPECREITGNPESYRLLKMPETSVVSATAPGDLPQTRTFKEYRNGQPIDPRDLPMQVAARDGVEVSGAELTLVFNDGEVRTIYGNAVPMRNNEGRVTGAISAFVDVTQLKESERALKDADRRKDEFLATLSHELRNPLAPINTAVQLLRNLKPPYETLQQLREMIERNVNHMVRLVNDLLEVSRISTGKIELQIERVDLANVVRIAAEISGPLIEARLHQLEIVTPPEPVEVTGDAVRLSQIVVNLLNNAAIYTPDRGRIRVSVERQGSDGVLIVTDNGPGIPAEMLDKVFELFTQIRDDRHQSPGGLGIGLALVKQLAEMHNGTVEAGRAACGGAEFRVQLPLASNTGQEIEEEGEEATDNSHVSRQILVVDDNVDAAESLAIFLSEHGHTVRTAYDGHSAIEKVSTFRPNAILLDLGMPGMDGIETATKIRSLPAGKEILIVALTGWGQEKDRRRTKEAGFDFHLVKPVPVSELLAVLKEGIPRIATQHHNEITTFDPPSMATLTAETESILTDTQETDTLNRIRFSKIVHELANYFFSIQMAAESLELADLADGSQKRILDLILNASQKGMGLAADMRDLLAQWEE